MLKVFQSGNIFPFYRKYFSVQFGNIFPVYYIKENRKEIEKKKHSKSNCFFLKRI